MKEPINKDYVLSFVEKNFHALQQLEVRGLPASTILLSYVMRVHKGYIRTVWKPSESILRSRFYSGLSAFRAALPMVLKKAQDYVNFEEVPEALRGLSAFCLPKGASTPSSHELWPDGLGSESCPPDHPGIQGSQQP